MLACGRTGLGARVLDGDTEARTGQATCPGSLAGRYRAGLGPAPLLLAMRTSLRRVSCWSLRIRFIALGTFPLVRKNLTLSGPRLRLLRFVVTPWGRVMKTDILLHWKWVSSGNNGLTPQKVLPEIPLTLVKFTSWLRIPHCSGTLLSLGSCTPPAVREMYVRTEDRHCGRDSVFPRPRVRAAVG